MPATVNSDLFLSAANILALKVGYSNVSKAFLGETLVFETDFGSSGFQWMTMTSITESTAAGIGQNNITVAITQSGGGMFEHGGMYQPQLFPPEYGVPTGGKQIANTQAGIFTAVFSQPVTDVLVAFASVGQLGTPVPVQVLDENGAPKPFTPIFALTSQPWSQTTYQNPLNVAQYTQFTGEEGFNIIRIDGTMSSVTFNYTTSEFYCTLCFGFVDQNAPPSFLLQENNGKILTEDMRMLRMIRAYGPSNA